MSETKATLDVGLIEESVKEQNSDGKPLVVMREKIVPPSDYEQLKLENRRLNAIVRQQNNLLMRGKVSDLSMLIDEFMTYSRAQMKKIALEVAVMQHTDGDVAKVATLIEYCRSLCNSLCEQCNFVTDDDDDFSAELAAFSDDLSSVVNFAEDSGDLLAGLSRRELTNLRQPLILFRRMMQDVKAKAEDSS